MGAFFGFIFGLWMVGTFLSWPYFWAKKTDRSQAPIVRRTIGLGWAVAWPYHAVTFFMNRSREASAKSDLQSAQDRVLGGGSRGGSASPAAGTPRPAPATGPSQSTIANPFDA